LFSEFIGLVHVYIYGATPPVTVGVNVELCPIQMDGGDAVIPLITGPD
jgi:hypothetical protein